MMFSRSLVVFLGYLTLSSGIQLSLKKTKGTSKEGQKMLAKRGDSLLSKRQSIQYDIQIDDSVLLVDISVGSSQINAVLDGMEVAFGLTGDSYFIGGSPKDFECSIPSYMTEDFSTVTATSGDSYCTDNGFYYTAESDNFSKNDSAKAFWVGTSSENSTGFYAQDSIEANTADLDEVVVKNFNFVVLDKTDVSRSYFSLGLPGGQFTNMDDDGYYDPDGYTYYNLLDSMKQQDIIKKKMFGLYFDNYGGVIDIGAVDAGKFSGKLTTLDLVNVWEDYGYKEPIAYAVTLDGLSVTVNSSEPQTIETDDAKTFISPGVSFTSFPSSIFDAIVQELDGDDSGFGIIIPCTSEYQDFGNFTFTLGDFKFDVPIGDFVLWKEPAREQCRLDIRNWYDDVVYLGPSVLEKLYMVFDQEDLTISLGHVSNDISKLVEVDEDTVYEDVDGKGSEASESDESDESDESTSSSKSKSSSKSSSESSSESSGTSGTSEPSSTEATFSDSSESATDVDDSSDETGSSDDSSETSTDVATSAQISWLLTFLVSMFSFLSVI